MPVRRSNQLSYEATDVGSWSYVGTYVPVMNESTDEMIYEKNQILNCGYVIKWSSDPRSYERNFRNCVEKPEKFRTSTGFESVTSRCRCDALTSWAMRSLMLEAGHLWVYVFPWWMNQRTKCVHDCEDHSFTWLHIRSFRFLYAQLLK